MTISELKKGLLEKMQSIFPKEKYKYYSMAVVEGYKRPSFFTSIKPVRMEPVNYNSRTNVVTLYINYMQSHVDEAEALDVIQKLKDLFGLSVKINDRHVDVIGFDYDFIGTEQNIPEISIDLEWMDRIEHVNNQPLMMSVEANIKNMEE